MKGLEQQICEEKRSAFQRRGYLVLRNFFDPGTVRRLQETSTTMSNKAAAILRDCERDEQSPAERALMYPEELIVVPEEKDLGQICRYEYMIGSFPEFKHIMRTIIVPTISTLINETVVPFKDKTNEKVPGGGRFGPHQDFVAYQYFGPRYNITALITIDPSNTRNGCVQFAENFVELAREVPTSVKSSVGGRPIFHYQSGGHSNGDIVPDISKHLVWNGVETNPLDLVIFDSFIPHYSEPNLSNTPRRAMFITFNKESEGVWYDKYYADKRANYHDPKFHVSTPTWREG